MANFQYFVYSVLAVNYAGSGRIQFKFTPEYEKFHKGKTELAQLATYDKGDLRLS